MGSGPQEPRSLDSRFRDHGRWSYGINTDVLPPDGCGSEARQGCDRTILGNFWFYTAKRGREPPQAPLLLATKLYGDMTDYWPDEGKLSALSIRRALMQASSRHRPTSIDLYQGFTTSTKRPRGTDLARRWSGRESTGKILRGSMR
jgi:hypothetical protein